MYKQNVSNIEGSHKDFTQVEHAKGRFDIQIFKAISILFCPSLGSAPLSTNTDCLIWTA